MIDETFAPDRTRIYYKQWPSSPDGDIDDNGTVRKMTDAEVAEWHARNPPPPLVPEADRIDDDHQQAALMLLAEDAALAVVLLERLAAAGGLDVEAARAEARAAMAALSADPALRDEMIRDRLR